MAGKKRKPEQHPVPSQKEMTHLIKQCPSLRDSALLSILYLTGARISEILMEVRPTDIELTKLGEQNILIIHNLPVLKRNRKKKNSKEEPPRIRGHRVPAIRRNVPVPYDKEREACDCLLAFAKTQPPDAPLFHITRARAWQIIKKYLYFPHFLRHTRSTHLVTYYGLNEMELTKFIGWKKTAEAGRYSHLQYKDLARKILGDP
jgi:integrase